MTTSTIFGQTGGGAAATDANVYTLTMMFTVSEPVALTGIWFNSPSATGATLPTETGIFDHTTGTAGTLVPGTHNTSPAWSGAAGSGWVKCSYDGSITLQPGHDYSVAVYLPGASNQQYGATAHYWDTGAGSGGITSGPLTALSNAAAAAVFGGTSGQDAFISPGSGLTYPTGSFNATNYWVDVEVTASAAAGAGQNTPSILVREMSQALVMTVQAGEQEWDEWVE